MAEIIHTCLTPEQLDRPIWPLAPCPLCAAPATGITLDGYTVSWRPCGHRFHAP